MARIRTGKQWADDLHSEGIIPISTPLHVLNSTILASWAAENMSVVVVDSSVVVWKCSDVFLRSRQFIVVKFVSEASPFQDNTLRCKLGSFIPSES